MTDKVFKSGLSKLKTVFHSWILCPISPMDILDLMNIAQTISANIKDLNLVTDSVDAIRELFPVLYICNNRVNCFINLHEFVFSPGVYEVLLFSPKEQQQQFRALFEQNPETTVECETNIQQRSKGSPPSIISNEAVWGWRSEG